MNKKKTYKIIFMQLGEIYEIFAKQIIPQMLYKTHFEGSSVKNAMNWAEGEMNKIVNK